MNYPIDHEFERIVQQAVDSGWHWEELEREILGCWPDGPEAGGRGWKKRELAEIRKDFEARR